MTDKPTPHTLTIVATGANHALLFKGNVSAQTAYRALTKQMGAVRVAQMEWEADDEKPRVLPLYSFEDDFGSSVTVDLLEVKSIRLTDLNAEQEGAGYLKVGELTAALAFEEHVKTDHPSLYTQLRMRQGAGGNSPLVMPGRVGH